MLVSFTDISQFFLFTFQRFLQSTIYNFTSNRCTIWESPNHSVNRTLFKKIQLSCRITAFKLNIRLLWTYFFFQTQIFCGKWTHQWTFIWYRFKWIDTKNCQTQYSNIIQLKRKPINSKHIILKFEWNIYSVISKFILDKHIKKKFEFGRTNIVFYLVKMHIA